MNIITIAGNIGRDAEMRTTQSGDSIASFSVADQGRKDSPAIWWRCTLWGKRADALAQYLVKGTQVTVIGEIQQRQYVDKEGHERTVMDVRVVDIKLQGGRREQAQPTSSSASTPVYNDYDSDDIPF